ncbi:MAG: hypothetical protein DWB45_08560 [Xanthomonadales bacterium]|nr:hypothetical protein [Xanthomonadales bacterium]
MQDDEGPQEAWMNPMSSRMAAWLESAWLARYLERGLDPAENDWFEAYLLDKPALLAAVDADNTLRAALASERSTFERGGKDAAAAGAVASARAPQRQWPRWAALAATLVAGVGIGQFALRPHMPASADGVIANPERIVFDTMRGATTPPLVQHGDSDARYLFVEVAVPPTAIEIRLRQGAQVQPLVVSSEGFVSFLIDRRTLAAGTPLAIAYTLDGQPHSQTLDITQRRGH